MKPILKKILRSNFANNLAACIAFCYIKLVFITSKWDYIGKEIFEEYIKNNKPFIVSFWHGHLLMLACAWQWQKPFYMLISNHRDGRIISKTMECFGIKTISGSTDKQGFQAARQIIKTLKDGNIVGITPDGPRGPREEVSDGILQMAKLTKADIIPIAYSASHLKKLNSWDKFRVALPFAKGIFVVGKPIQASTDLIVMKQQLEQGMKRAENKADADVSKNR
jgi:lysophospholipid acyltransferase (LPLAT)-like uncharacterized protein